MTFTYPIYSDHDFKNLKKFKVYLNYLQCISNIFEQEEFKGGRHLIEVINSKSFASIQKKEKNIAKIQSVLRNAWATEMQLSFTAEFSAFSSSAHWAIVQLYYSVYLSICALLLAMNDVSPGYEYDSHKGALNKISTKIKSSPALYTSPWNLTYSGDPKIDKQVIILNNLGDPISIKSSPLSKNYEYLAPYARFLKTTRAKQIEEKRKSWLTGKDGKGKRNLPAKIRKNLINELNPTTLFDCLYRLRIKANYRDVETFLKGADIEEWASAFNYSLINISRNTLLATELLIVRYVGKNNYNTFINDFKKYSKNSYNAVEKRWDILSSLLYTMDTVK